MKELYKYTIGEVLGMYRYESLRNRTYTTIHGDILEYVDGEVLLGGHELTYIMNSWELINVRVKEVARREMTKEMIEDRLGYKIDIIE